MYHIVLCIVIVVTLAVVNGTIPGDCVVSIHTFHSLTQVSIRQDKPTITRRRHHRTVNHHLCAQRPVAWQRQLRTELRCLQNKKLVT